jgi:hypothetical protein
MSIDPNWNLDFDPRLLNLTPSPEEPPEEAAPLPPSLFRTPPRFPSTFSFSSDSSPSRISVSLDFKNAPPSPNQDQTHQLKSQLESIQKNFEELRQRYEELSQERAPEKQAAQTEQRKAEIQIQGLQKENRRLAARVDQLKQQLRPLNTAIRAVPVATDHPPESAIVLNERKRGLPVVGSLQTNVIDLTDQPPTKKIKMPSLDRWVSPLDRLRSLETTAKSLVSRARLVAHLKPLEACLGKILLGIYAYGYREIRSAEVDVLEAELAQIERQL